MAAQRVIYGTIVGAAPRGTTASGNPIVDVSILPADGEGRKVLRVSHDASLAYDVPNHQQDGKPRAYVLTEAGRVSHEDVYTTSAYRRLYAAFPRGAEVVTVVTHVSSSGMSRRFRVLGVDVRPVGVETIASDLGAPSIVDEHYVADRTLDAARVLGWKTNDRGELVVSGAGMDMGFHTVYTLASKLYGDGYALNHRGL